MTTDTRLPKILVGDVRGKKWSDRLQSLGWGRMWVATRMVNVQRYQGESWALDNGVFGAWMRGEDWDGSRFLDGVERCVSTAECDPLFVVMPDKVGDWPETVALADRWWGKLNALPCYLVIQDGAVVEQIETLAPLLAGLFLGGTDDLKPQAGFWRSVATDLRLGFHYGRASTRDRILDAHRVGCDSLDSTQGLWTRKCFQQFRDRVEFARTQVECL